MPYVAALFLGLAAMLLRVVYVFLPLAYLSDVLVFAALGMLTGYLWPRHAKMNFFLLVGPTYLFLVLIVIGFDWEHVLRGVGIVHVVALITVPAAAWIGIASVARSRLRAVGGSESPPSRRPTRPAHGMNTRWNPTGIQPSSSSSFLAASRFPSSRTSTSAASCWSCGFDFPCSQL